MTKRPVVLFLCTHNAGRSVAAHALMEHYAAGRVEVRSAGSEPAERLNPAVVEVLRERGLVPPQATPRGVADEGAANDVVVTMGCGDSCPFFPATRYVDWPLRDPSGLPLEEVRPIVDEIERRVQALLAELTAPQDARGPCERP